MNVSNELLKTYRRVEVLFDEIYPSLKNYPRYEQPSTVAQIKEQFHLTISKILRASEVKTKRRPLMDEIASHVYHLISLFHFSRRHKFISLGFHSEINLKLSTISVELHDIHMEIIRK